jgi:hypothetical protein
VTSAQLGVLHGLAALHQLLLWTEGNFELRPEEIVPWRQIPLEPGELIEASERFLEEVREAAGSMSPSDVYEQSRTASGDVLGAIPAALGSILRLFDGNRTVADVIEDSPYRMFETLRIALRLRDAKILARCNLRSARPRQSALGIERWLNGSEPEPTRKKRKRKRSGGTGRTKRTPIDWSDVMPAEVQAAPKTMSQVVPATSATGEVESEQQATSAVGGERSVEVDPAMIDEAAAIAADPEAFEPEPGADPKKE